MKYPLYNLGILYMLCIIQQEIVIFKKYPHFETITLHFFFYHAHSRLSSQQPCFHKTFSQTRAWCYTEFTEPGVYTSSPGLPTHSPGVQEPSLSQDRALPLGITHPEFVWAFPRGSAPIFPKCVWLFSCWQFSSPIPFGRLHVRTWNMKTQAEAHSHALLTTISSDTAEMHIPLQRSGVEGQGKQMETDRTSECAEKKNKKWDGRMCKNALRKDPRRNLRLTFPVCVKAWIGTVFQACRPCSQTLTLAGL